MYRLYTKLIFTIICCFHFVIAKNLILHNRYNPQIRELLDIKFSGNALKNYSGAVESTASRIDTNKRSLPAFEENNIPDLTPSAPYLSIN